MWPQVPLTAWSKTFVCARSLVGFADWNAAGGMVVSYECFMLSGRGLFDGPIYRPGESCHVCVDVCGCVCVWVGVCASLSVIRCKNDRLHLTVNRFKEVRVRTK